MLPQSELLLELWTWDFLDDNAKARWKERIEHPYGTVETRDGSTTQPTPRCSAGGWVGDELF